jgi:tetratricopeptide (TPR) repeat protein
MMLRLHFSLLAGCLLLSAQHSSPNPGKIVPRIWPGYGELRFEVSSSNPEARNWANQGLRLVYAFNHPEAAASFRKSTEIDPNCAMCWWGLGFALGNNINAPLMPENARPAYDAAQKALAIKDKATPREAAYIEALSLRYQSENPKDRSSLDKAFAEAMRKLSAQFPDDLDAKTLAADALMNLTPWKLWDRAGKPNIYTLEIVSLLEEVLQRDPAHMGANHLYIHTVEASPTPERALSSANTLASLAPSSGHLVHMPSHIFTRTGDYQRSAIANIQAAALDKAYFEAVGGPTYYTPYWYHNLHFLSAARSMTGQYREAIAAITEAARELEPVARMEAAFEASLSMPLFTEVRFQQWDKILALPEPASFSVTVNNAWHFARGMAQAAKGDLQAARTSQAAFNKAINALSSERTFGLNQEKAIMSIAAHALAAKIAQVEGNREAALEHLRQAVAAEDQLAYDEPAGWYYPPTREALGALLIKYGKADLAEQTFREELVNNRRSGRALYGLMESLKAQNKSDAARMVESLYQRAWALADNPMTLDQLF